MDMMVWFLMTMIQHSVLTPSLLMQIHTNIVPGAFGVFKVAGVRNY